MKSTDSTAFAMPKLPTFPPASIVFNPFKLEIPAVHGCRDLNPSVSRHSFSDIYKGAFSLPPSQSLSPKSLSKWQSRQNCRELEWAQWGFGHAKRLARGRFVPYTVQSKCSKVLVGIGLNSSISLILSKSHFFHLYLNVRIPISAQTTMANNIAPSRPNNSHPITNATTEPIPSAPQFMLIAISCPRFIIGIASLLVYLLICEASPT